MWNPWRKPKDVYILRQPRPFGWSSAQEAGQRAVFYSEEERFLGCRVGSRGSRVFLTDPLECSKPPGFEPADLVFASRVAGILFRPTFHVYGPAGLPGCGPWRRVAASAIPAEWRAVAEAAFGLCIPETGVVRCLSLGIESIRALWAAFEAAEGEEWNAWRLAVTERPAPPPIIEED